VLVATKDFSPGEVILVEKPLLMPTMAAPGKSGQWPGLLREGERLPPELHEALMVVLAFAQASLETQEEVRKGFYAPRENGGADEETEQRASIAVRGLNIGDVTVSKEDAVTTILALRYNSFSYPALGADGKVEDTCALFSLGSKCEHSCLPRAVYKADAAVAPIAAGERISISYVDCTMPTALRHRHCWERFSFVCRCHRCAGDPAGGTPAPPDAARTLKCWVCGCRLQPLSAGSDCQWLCVGGGEAFSGCGFGWGADEVRKHLGGLDDLAESLKVQEELARGGLTDLGEVEKWIQKLEAMGVRHWAVRALQRRRLGLLLQSPGDLPQGAGQVALDGLLAAVEDGGVGAATQVAWEGIALATAVRLCRARVFVQAGTLAAACLPVLRLVCPKGAGLLDLAERLEEACGKQDPGVLDERREVGPETAAGRQLFRFLE